jgi:NitT/TauT family transport system substrate-binding protein
MAKFQFLRLAALVPVFALAACGGAETATAVPGSPAPGPTATPAPTGSGTVVATVNDANMIATPLGTRATDGDATKIATAPATAAADGTPGKPLTHIVVAMGYIANVQFAPYYLAQDRGYYAAEGLDVEFKYGQVNDLLKVVADGGIDYANVGGDEMVPAVAQGIPVRYVMTSYYRYPTALATVRGLGARIEQPSDMKGHKIGIPGAYGSSYIGLKALLKAGKLQESDINLQSIGFTQVQALLGGQVDAAMVYAMNEPVQVSAGGKSVDVLKVSDYADLAASGIATSNKKIAAKPDEIRAFVRATLKGTADTLTDPDAAFASTLKRTPELAVDQQPIQRLVLTAALAYFRPPEGRTLGSSDATTWKNTESFLREIGLSPKEIDPATLWTNDFIPPP